MNLKLETEFSKALILQEIDALKKQIDSMRPLPPDVEGRVMQKLRLDWNYNSNAIEGNKLSYGETTALLMHGITAKGKPLKDHLDIQGHNNVVGYLERMVKDERDFTESDIRALHEVLLVEPYFVDAQTVDGLSTRKWIEIGKYKSLPNHVETRTREIHYYATPEETPALMNDLMSWYVEASENKEIHPVIIAALFHHKFVEIHPFDDGNGRMARILMNLILMKRGYPVAIIKNDNKDNYYALLSRADVGDSWPFVEYIIDRLQNSIQLYLKAINGGDVDEDEDIDKEIELLRIQLGGGVNIKEKKTVELVQNVFFKSILPLSIKIVDKLRGFEEYFFKNNYWLRFYYSDGNKDFELIGTEYTTEYFRRLPQIDEVTGTEINNLINMEIDLRFVEYKNPDNSFNVIELLNIQLGVYYYSFIGEEGTMVSKLYEEQLSIHDQNKIIKSVIRNFKNKFEFNLKKANS